MYGNVKQNYNQLTWSTGTVSVPRCKNCTKFAATEDESSTAIGCFITLSIIAGIAIGIWGASVATGFAVAIIGSLVSSIPLAIIGSNKKKTYMKRMGVTELREVYAYPLILEQEKKGWSIGDKPPEANQ